MENYQPILTRENRKTLAISISRNGEVVVKAPLSMPSAEINRFLREKQNWVDKKLGLIYNVLDKNADIISYKKFLFFGVRYTPYWAEVKNFVFDNECRALVPKSLDRREILDKLKQFYRKEAKRILTERVKIVSNYVGSEPRSIKFSDAKNRWGSCSANRVISLNWRLVLLPTRIVDYVIVHELSHIEHMDHSERFWKSVSNVIPDFGILRKDLRGFSFLLNLFR